MYEQQQQLDDRDYLEWLISQQQSYLSGTTSPYEEQNPYMNQRQRDNYGEDRFYGGQQPYQIQPRIPSQAPAWGARRNFGDSGMSQSPYYNQGNGRWTGGTAQQPYQIQPRGMSQNPWNSGGMGMAQANQQGGQTPGYGPNTRQGYQSEVGRYTPQSPVGVQGYNQRPYQMTPRQGGNRQPGGYL